MLGKAVLKNNNSHISLQQWLIIIHCCCANSIQLKNAGEEAQVSSVNICGKIHHLTIFQSLQGVQRVYSSVISTNVTTLAGSLRIIRLHGPGFVVQIDKSIFHHKPMVCKNRCYFSCHQNHRGRPSIGQTIPALGYMEMLACQNAMNCSQS